MVLADSSAWIEYLRGTGSPVCSALEERLGEDLAICGPVRLEVLAGARSEHQLVQLRRLLERATLIATHPIHYDQAASLHRACRAAGETVRKLMDCLIAAHALDAGIPLLGLDADFDVLARHTPLQLVALA